MSRYCKLIQSVDELKIVDLPIPTLDGKKDQLVIKVVASAANFFDILQVQGKYQTQPPFPWIAGYEFAGVVAESTSSGFKVGDRVFGGSQGAYSEYIKVNVKSNPVLHIPDGLSFEEASTLYITAPTSYLAIFERGKVRKGETVLIHAGAGGVGLMAVQMAKAAGAFVIATASTEDKLDICKKFGADVGINYKDKDWIQQIKAVTKGKGCDVIYDPVGLVDQSLKIVAFNGRILIVGFAGGAIEKIAMNKLLLKQCSVVGVFWGGTTINDPATVPKVWGGILNLLTEKKLKATVFDKVYHGVDSVPSALAALGNRETWGKVVIKMNTGSKY
ncbi:hypothetical protein HK103_001778 [Boothiomyces macroporosus]|uniref:Enoyl reductase (ER) domain-containing protein n=1 Tax=Boothiomyces macroporosus TaxID=261099 RepID=A0AAD5UDU6_9FUNG|nr:hypothetical protein HK103_001778 [Boothiomyces macroporosus]